MTTEMSGRFEDNRPQFDGNRFARRFRHVSSTDVLVGVLRFDSGRRPADVIGRLDIDFGNGPVEVLVPADGDEVLFGFDQPLRTGDEFDLSLTLKSGVPAPNAVSIDLLDERSFADADADADDAAASDCGCGGAGVSRAGGSGTTDTPIGTDLPSAENLLRFLKIAICIRACVQDMAGTTDLDPDREQALCACIARCFQAASGRAKPKSQQAKLGLANCIVDCILKELKLPQGGRFKLLGCIISCIGANLPEGEPIPQFEVGPTRGQCRADMTFDRVQFSNSDPSLFTPRNHAVTMTVRYSTGTGEMVEKMTGGRFVRDDNKWTFKVNRPATQTGLFRCKDSFAPIVQITFARLIYQRLSAIVAQGSETLGPFTCECEGTGGAPETPLVPARVTHPRVQGTVDAGFTISTRETRVPK